MMKIITTNDAPEAIGPYSQAVESNGFLYTSGQIPMKSDGELVDGDIEAQTHQVFKNLTAVLKGASLDLTDVVKVNIFISDMDEFSRLNDVYAQYFTDHKPARSTVQVARLPLDVKLELEVVARAK